MKTQRSNSIVSDSNDFSSKGINITAPEFIPTAKITNGLNKIEVSKNDNAYGKIFKKISVIIMINLSIF